MVPSPISTQLQIWNTFDLAESIAIAWPAFFAPSSAEFVYLRATALAAAIKGTTPRQRSQRGSRRFRDGALTVMMSTFTSTTIKRARRRWTASDFCKLVNRLSAQLSHAREGRILRHKKPDEPPEDSTSSQHARGTLGARCH